jgi:hypothetical protein
MNLAHKLLVSAVVGSIFIAPAAFAGGRSSGLANAQQHVDANMLKNNNTHSRAPSVLGAVSTGTPGPGFGSIVSGVAKPVSAAPITTAPITGN